MSINHRLGKTVVRALSTSAALAMMSFMTPTPALSQDSGKAGQWVAPERASHRENPLPPTADAVKLGQKLYRRDCQECHGKAGHGDGPEGASLKPLPANLASTGVQSQSDGALFWKITQGRGEMPKAELDENEKWAVIAYVRTLAERR
jgi:mono/diheme cytochrome c family protein